MMTRAAVRVLTPFTVVVLAACQPKPAPMPIVSGKSAALRTMETVAIAAHRCWFASKDPAFRAYSFANELNSMTGSPRFLLVPKGNFGGRPLLVVQSQGAAGRLDAFGPLMEQPLGARIAADLSRWKAGNSSCATAA